MSSPSHSQHSRDSSPTPFSGWTRPALTRRELFLRALTGIIKNKKNWAAKYNETVLREKWLAELWATAEEQHRATGHPWQAVDDSVVAHVTCDLSYSAASSYASVDSAVEGVYQGDDLIPADLRETLIVETDRLRRQNHDWHPGSNNQVLDLVHPSMYPYLINVSVRSPPKPAASAEESLSKMGWSDKELLDAATVHSLCRGKPLCVHIGDDRNDYDVAPSVESTRFQWLPARFYLGEGGAVQITSYINNLHPVRSSALYSCLEGIFGRLVPLFERTLGWHRLGPSTKIKANIRGWLSGLEDAERNAILESDGVLEPNSDDNEDVPELGAEWYETQKPEQPEVPKFCPFNAYAFPLAGRNLQVIVKLADIVLTPNRPRYPGGVWHVEGMLNEHIVASGIYYYINSNIAEDYLAFRAPVDEPDYQQSDNAGTYEIYGLKNDMNLVQELGAVRTHEGRCIVFPNVYQHRVQPFELADKSRGGRRAILVFFLVDPGHPVVSSDEVPPQQDEWYLAELERLTYDSVRLPKDVWAIVVAYHVRSTLSQVHAQEIRLALMEERKLAQDSFTEEFVERPFSLCEH
jgi:hypothetical protein